MNSFEKLQEEMYAQGGLDYLNEQNEKKDIELAQLRQRIAELEAGQGEPVAWQIIQKNGSATGPIVRDFSELKDLHVCVYDPEIDTLRPLYTSAPRIPEGWQLVPKEPTGEMADAAKG